MRRALCFLAIVNLLSACATTSQAPPLAGDPHSPGDVVAAGERQATRDHAPQVPTEWLRRQPRLAAGQPEVAETPMMPVWLVPHRRGQDLIGGQWIWTPTHAGVPVGPVVAPTAPTLKPTADDAEAGAIGTPTGEVEPPAAGVPNRMQAQYRALQRALGLQPSEGDRP